ncbi:MAG: aldo/keto reductase [Deltaproteobacteria bacterium]|nr:aldo/keto reductase [Deltaproteobacteria bacterium]
MSFYEQHPLGRTGLSVGRLGVACSYGAPTEAFEEAFERGVNYFYYGSTRKEAMARAIRNITAKGKRDELVILLQSYSRSAALMEFFFRRGLISLGLDHADVLLLGWYNKPPSPRILDRARSMRQKGLFRYLAISGHYRPLFPTLASQPDYDIFHIRYNAVHRGAEQEVFSQMPVNNRPGLVTYTATRWGDLLTPKKMPSGESPPRGADCYRFVLTQPTVDVCMTGPRSRAEMQEALTALDLGPLSEEELARMRRLGDYIHANHRRPWAG